MQINTFIVEDTLLAAQSLSILLSSFPEINNIGISSTKEDAINQIKFFKPNTIFMDINLGHDTGFDVLDECNGFFQNVIFTTAYDEYALKSYEYNAVHYVLKPITMSNLKIAVDKIIAINKTNELVNNTTNIKPNIESTKTDSFFYYENKQWKTMHIPEVMYVRGESSYSSIYTENLNVKLSKNLKTVSENFLNHPNFIRIHKSYLVNTNFIKTIRKGLQPKVILSNDIELPISLLEKDKLFKLLGI